ncbi:MAG: prepilin peptidase [Desulfocucumaceae bacterium]
MLQINILLAAALAAVCAWTDIKSRAIWNIFTYPAAVTGLMLSVWAGNYANIYGAIIIFAIYLYFFIAGKMGAGDLKLAVALSLFMGAQPALLGTLAAGVLMLAWGFVSTWYKTGQLRAAVLVAVGKLPGGSVPFGAIMGPSAVAIALIQQGVS